MSENITARAMAIINASSADVWDALVTPEAIKQYMFGTDVHTDWKEGGPIAWKGEWQGKAYEDKGTILQVQPGRLLQYTHFSPLSGSADIPQNYHTVTIELSEVESGTQVVLMQDNNATEEARAHSEKNWAMMLDALKKFVEEEHATAKPADEVG